MRVKLSDWNSAQWGGSIARRGMRPHEIESLVKHGQFDLLRKLRALYDLCADFFLFCRWHGEIHMTGRRLGPTYRRIFQRPHW